MKIVCLGDSITCNWNTPSYVDDWQELVNEKYGPGVVQLEAAGINGETAQDAYYRIHRDVVERAPKLLTVMFGHNDADPMRQVSPVMFQNYLRKILNYTQHYLPDTTIWLLSPSLIGDPQYQERYRPYLEGIQQAAQDKKVTFVSLWDAFEGENLDDIFTYTMNSTYLRGAGKDWIHPNEKGNRLLAERLMSELEKSGLVTV